MNKITLLPLIAMILACASNQGISTKPPKVIGNWQWIETSGGFAGVKKTPETTNQIKHLQITKDSIFYYENGELKNTQPYKLELGMSNLSKKNAWKIAETVSKVFVYRTDSTLALVEDCYDCFTHKYVKMSN